MADIWADPMHGADWDATDQSLADPQAPLEAEILRLRARIDELLTNREHYLARIETLEAALRPFALEFPLTLGCGVSDSDPYFTRTTQLRVGDLRRATAALKPKRESEAG